MVSPDWRLRVDYKCDKFWSCRILGVQGLGARPQGLPLSITLPLSSRLCVKQPIIHDMNIHSFD